MVGLALWSSAFVFGDATEEASGVGADLELGTTRTAVLPVEAAPLHALVPFQNRDLGRLVRLRGVAESRAHANALWVRAETGQRILVRFEPPPPEGALQRFAPGTSVDLDGYLQKISRAEFLVWMDTLGVSIPRPPPGRKFGDLPPPSFAQVDSLFVKGYYISVRPEALEPRGDPAAG